MSDEYRLGQPVWIWASLQRLVGSMIPYGPTGNGRWYPKIWVGVELPHRQEGIIVGKRTLSDGEVQYTYDSGVIYRQKSTFTAWLVATDIHRKPVLVWPKDIQERP